MDEQYLIFHWGHLQRSNLNVELTIAFPPHISPASSTLKDTHFSHHLPLFQSCCSFTRLCTFISQHQVPHPICSPSFPSHVTCHHIPPSGSKFSPFLICHPSFSFSPLAFVTYSTHLPLHPSATSPASAYHLPHHHRHLSLPAFWTV